MAIIIPNPVTVPAVPAQVAQTADQLWINDLRIVAISPTQPIKVIINVSPYVSATQTVVKNKAKQLLIKNLEAEAYSNPAVGQAVGAIYAAVQAIAASKNLYGPPLPTPPAQTPPVVEPPAAPPVTPDPPPSPAGE